MNKKKQKKLQETILLNAMRVLFFVLFPAVFSTAFSGVKYAVTQLGMGKGMEWNAFLLTFLAVIAFTVLFGRFFCGFACAFGAYGDFLYWLVTKIRKKYKKKPMSLPEAVTKILRMGKYIVLLAIVVLCILGKGGAIAANSPWSVFSRLQSGNLPAVGIGMLLLVLISIGMCLEPRFFCRFLCPLGAVFSLLPILPLSQVRRDRENCIKGCQACKRNCPARLEIQDNEGKGQDRMGECFSCGKCMSICPKSNITTPIVKNKSQILYWHIIRGAVLAVLLYLITR